MPFFDFSKISLLSLCFCGILLSLQCKDEPEPFLFEIPYQLTFSVPAGLNPFVIHPIRAQREWLENQLEANLQQRGISMADISAIEPGVATLQMVGTDFRFDFLREITININDDNAQDQANNLELFYVDEERLIDAGSFLDLIPSLTNATGELDESIFSIRMLLSPRVANTETFEAQLNFTLQVR